MDNSITSPVTLSIPYSPAFSEMISPVNMSTIWMVTCQWSPISSAMAMAYDVETMRWDILATERIGEDDIYVYYSAESPTLSVFAVTGEEIVVVVVPPPPPTPEPTPKPWYAIPGFGAIFAILGLLAVAYLLRRGLRRGEE